MTNVEPSVHGLSKRSNIWLRVELILCHIWILGICAVLIGAFIVQFAKGELPCPLCIIQRMCMILAALGPAFVILEGRSRASYGFSIIGSGFGMSVMAAVGGMAVSARQVLLHIGKGDPGYGMPVFGMHLYTWALVVFIAILVVSGLTLLFEPRLDLPKPKKMRPFTQVTLVIFAVIIAANAVVVLLESGPNWFLPANPDHYKGLELLTK